MNFAELYKPYETTAAPSVDALVSWLLKEYPQNIVDMAMLSVFTELQNGWVVPADKDHDATRNLWVYVKETCKALKKVEIEVYLKHLEDFHANLSLRIDAEWSTLSWWRKIWEVLRGRA